ncbi:MAG: hypothetical protein LHV69_03585 [Elusimicrobia bacterium]|nr:hypothetical protein [Candidatus Obscuribacterium magneticum]
MKKHCTLKIVDCKLKFLHSAICIFAFCILLFPSLAFAADPEDVDEMMARKARRTSASWPTAQLEDRNNHFIWQPETFMYKDIQTGHEVWKLSDTNGAVNYYHNDITLPVWSADGRRLAFGSVRPTSAFNNYQSWNNRYSIILMFSDANGRFLRPAPNAPNRAVGSYSVFWSPQIPDTYYAMGSNSLGSSAQGGVLYKAVLSDLDLQRGELVRDYPMAGSGVYLDVVSISPDGKRVMVRDRAASPYNLLPTTVFPEGTAHRDAANGYSYYRGPGMSAYQDTPSTFNYAHADTYRLIGPNGHRWFTVVSGSHCHWYLNTVGSAPDGGPLYTDGTGEIVPASGCTPNPFIIPYMSHNAPDNWGQYSVFSSVDANPIGPGVWDLENNVWVVRTFGGGASHHDWHGFTDWTASSRGTGGDGGCQAEGYVNNDRYIADRLYAQIFNQANSQITVAYTHTLFNDNGCYSGQYNGLTRPGQSPDGTKIAFTSTFLNPKTGTTDSQSDIFWAVAMYPFPPTSLEVAANNGVEIRWLPAKYTDRTWTNGEELFAREIKQYHLWRAPSAQGPWDVVQTISAEYANDTFTNTLKPRFNGSWVNSSNKISIGDNPGAGTWYYALTSEEWSGLESQTLSQIVGVQVSGSGVTEIGRTNGIAGFWTTKPQAPMFTRDTDPASGYPRLAWADQGDTSKIRYYNIYYSDAGDPQAIQQHRIASLPVGTNTYLDWLAGSNPHYGVTAVDRYGNESDINVNATGNLAPRVRAGDDQILTLPVLAAQINGQVTEEETYTASWSQVRGPQGVTFDNAGALSTIAHFPGVGVYVLRLTTNDGTYTTFDEVQITIRDVTTPPGQPAPDQPFSPDAKLITFVTNVISPKYGDKIEMRVNHKGGDLRIDILNRKGDLVITLAEGSSVAGLYTFTWMGQNKDGKKVASGTYLLKVQSGDQITTGKLAVMK